MNKYEEAKSNIVNTLARIVSCQVYKNQFSHNLDVLGELVEKATPKKPIGKYTQYKCPVCGRRVRSGKGSSSHIRDNVCQRCYQVLDWGDEE